MFCHKCGAQITEGAVFCLKCGTKVIYDTTDSQRMDASAFDSGNDQQQTVIVPDYNTGQGEKNSAIGQSDKTFDQPAQETLDDKKPSVKHKSSKFKSW